MTHVLAETRSAAPEAPAILVVDDDADTRSNLRDILELDGFHVECAGSGREVLARTDLPTFTAILLDRKLPDGSGEDFLPRIRAAAPQAAVFMVTAFSDLQGAIAALRQGAADYILKPINPDALRAGLARVAERFRLQQERERSEAAFRTLIEVAPCVILILAADNRLLYFSPFAEELTGYHAADVLGKDFLETLLEADQHLPCLERIRKVLGGHPVRDQEVPIRCRDGSRRWILWNCRRLDDYAGREAVLAVGQDITNLKRAQEQALRTERLAAIGQMMTGLAHESGNALARSQSCLEMLAWEVEGNPAALNLIDRIQKAQDHLKQLYEEVRGYAAPIKLDLQPWNLPRVWRMAWENLAVARKDRLTRLVEEVDVDDPTCLVDQFRMEQVFRNIFENALAACPEEAEIRIRMQELDEGNRREVVIAVQDNGPGLDPEQRRRIFEPFFTTKTRGTGLGMAIVRRIVEAHLGRIGLGPELQGGAEILLFLPRRSP